jgi:hypothetical protein
MSHLTPLSLPLTLDTQPPTTFHHMTRHYCSPDSASLSPMHLDSTMYNPQQLLKKHSASILSLTSSSSLQPAPFLTQTASGAPYHSVCPLPPLPPLHISFMRIICFRFCQPLATLLSTLYIVFPTHQSHHQQIPPSNPHTLQIATPPLSLPTSNTPERYPRPRLTSLLRTLLTATISATTTFPFPVVASSFFRHSNIAVNLFG